MKIRFLSLIAVLFLVAACGSSPPEPNLDDFAWCYQFDFINDSHDLSFVSGSATPNGLESTGGVLGVSYDHGVILEPAYMSAEIQVVTFNNETRNVAGSFNIFGVQANLQSDVQSIITTISGAPSNSSTFGSTASVSISTNSDSTVRVRKLNVYGRFIPNPFGTDNCGDGATATPPPTSTFIPLPSPTPSPSPTNTPTATNTPAPTGTPDDDWCRIWDVSTGFSDWSLTSSYIPGTAPIDSNGIASFTTGFGNADLKAAFATMPINGFTVTQVVMEGHIENGLYERGWNRDSRVAIDGANINGSYHWSSGDGSNSISDRDIYIINSHQASSGSIVLELFPSVVQNGDTPQGYGYISQVTVYGTGYNPFGVDDCSPTTPTPEPTPEPSWCYQFNFTQNDGNWNLADTSFIAGEQNYGQYSPTIGWQSNLGRVAIEIIVPSRVIYSVETTGGTRTRLYSHEDPYQVGSDDEIAEGTDSLSYGGATFTRSVWVENDIGGTISSVKLEGNFTNPFGADNCVDDLPTSTPQSTFTPMPTQTAMATPTIQATSTPNPSDDSNSFSSSGTCQSKTGAEPSDDGNGKWTEWLFGGINNLVECVVMPPINFIGNIASQTLAAVGSMFDLASNAFAYGQAGFQWTFGKLFPFIGAWVRNFWSFLSYYIAGFFSSVFGLVSGLFELINGLITSVVNFVKSILDFIFVGFRTVSRLFALWNTTTPEKPPGLPDCVNDPLNYDICAVWYLLDNTFFAGIGSFIVPALNVLILLLIALFFLETVVERMQKLWEVLRD